MKETMNNRELTLIYHLPGLRCFTYFNTINPLSEQPVEVITLFSFLTRKLKFREVTAENHTAIKCRAKFEAKYV